MLTIYSLADLLGVQSEQQELWYRKGQLTDDQRRQWIDELIHGLYEEVAELARAARSGHHIVRPQRQPTGNVTEQLVDIMKYLLAMADLMDVDAGTLTQRFLAKTASVEREVHQYRLDLEGRRVFVTDLDACVADLTPFMEATGGMYNGADVGLLATEERKAEWYDKGGFLELPLIPGAREALLEAQDQGCLIAIITARPVWEHTRIRPDTVTWLKQHRVPSDILLFNKDKFDAVYQSVYPARVVAFVEDRDKHAMELASHHVKPVLLMSQPWNEGMAPMDGVVRVNNWGQVCQYMRAADWGRDLSWGAKGA